MAAEKKMSAKAYKEVVETFITNTYSGVCDECKECQYLVSAFRYDTRDEFFKEDFLSTDDDIGAFEDRCLNIIDRLYETYERLDEVSDTAERLSNRVWATRLNDTDQLIYKFAMLNIVQQCHDVRDTLIKWYKEVEEYLDTNFHMEVPFGDKEGVVIHE